MKRAKSFLVIILFALFALLTFITSAQDDTCPAVLDRAIALTDAACAQVGRNQACYGNLHLTAETQPDVTDFTFDQPGDIADVIDIASLKLDPFDAAAQTWGVSLMKLQANLPDTLPGQNVTVLLFGDVEVRNAVREAGPTLNVTATSGLNVRGGPGTGYAIIGGLASGDTTTADGRLEDSSWLRIQLSDGRAGWVFAQLVTPAGDVSGLPVRAADDLTPSYRPMQAFYFRSGVGRAECAGRVENGLIIQTPGVAREVVLSVNEVNIKLGTTLFFQTTPDNALVISALKGKAEIQTHGVIRTVEVGKQVSVPLDDNLAASGPPSQPQPITDTTLATLPFGLLPFSVDVPSFLKVEEAPTPTATPTVVETVEPPVAPTETPAASSSSAEGTFVRVRNTCLINSGSFDGPALSAVPAGQPMTLYIGWVALSPELVNQFTNAVTFNLTFDGQPVPFAGATPPESYHVPPGSDLPEPAFWSRYSWGPLVPTTGTHTISLSATISPPVIDGWDSNGDGEPDIYSGFSLGCSITVVG